MLWWKEWRETRFGFLTALFFITGLYFSLTTRRTLADEYFLAILLEVFGLVAAILMGSSALTSEIADGTIVFLLSKPTGRARFLITKYIIRGLEVIAIISLPLLTLFTVDWKTHIVWMWSPPYLAQQYLMFCVLLTMLVYSASFLFSVLFREQALSAVVSVAFAAGFVVVKGVPLLRIIFALGTMELEILLLASLSAAALVASLLLFRIKEY